MRGGKSQIARTLRLYGGPGRDRTDDLPGKPGRAGVSLFRINQHLDRAVRFPAFQLPFATTRLHNCVELLLVDRDPRSSTTCGWSLSALVLFQSNLCIRRRPDIEAPAALTFEDVNGWHNAGLVDLVGIEPTTSSMPWKRAPSCATGPRLAGQLFYCRGSRPVRQTPGDPVSGGSGGAMREPNLRRIAPAYRASRRYSNGPARRNT